jgi:Holliday junction DNA helicase RuvA
MIGWLSGRVLDAQQPGKLVLDVNGVGYDVETSLATFFQLESVTNVVSLYIHTVVREDALLLYGFIDKHERALFRALIKVNGIGPKMAIAILSSITPDDFIRCIQQENATLLTRLPGIGKKTAERLVVEMKDSLSSLNEHVLRSAISVSLLQNHHQQEAICALEALGYKPQEAAKMVKQVDDGHKNCEQLIRQALQQLAKV